MNVFDTVIKEFILILHESLVQITTRSKMKHMIITLIQLSCLVFGVFSQDTSERTQTECGGTLKADSSSLSYPGGQGEELIPGETCVWTIHLETTRDFRINFTQFDVNASSSSCSNGAVRLYSLSNLVPGDRIEEYSFCSENSPSDTFYLGGNIAVLVLHVSSSNSRPGSGFTINWEGNAFDPLGTKHIATFSSAASGVISYPGIGTYESSLAATWLVSNERNSDLQLSELKLESCSNSDPCTCDALILYDISSTGNLKETTRLCSNVSSPITTYSLPNSFLLAFFTDFIAAPSGATGFSVLYYPSDGTSDPSTPDRGTSTTPEPEETEKTTTESLETTTTGTPEDEVCGQTITSSAFTIRYKPYTTYNSHERCVWVLAPSNAAQFNLTLNYGPVKPPGDGLIISSIDRVNTGELVTHYLGNGSFTLDGSVLIVTFYSDAYTESTGFILEYEVTKRHEGNQYAPPTSEILSKPNSMWPDSCERVRYPASGGDYPNSALATFLYTPGFSLDTRFQKYARVSIIEMERSCDDAIYVYEFAVVNNRWEKHPQYKLCDGPERDYELYSNEMLLMIFVSDSSLGYKGFQTDFCMKNY